MRKNAAAIILAGGKGTRLGASVPKQFLPLGDTLVIQHSLRAFLDTPSISDIVIVCEQKWQSVIEGADTRLPISFALPGIRRQDSVYQGLQKVPSFAQVVCIHDAARPFIEVELIEELIAAAYDVGGAAAALRVTETIKQADARARVLSTIPRNALWQMQTPQAIRTALLHQGFAHACKHYLEVTDDVSLIEAIGHPVQLIEGRPSNVKITTAHDLHLARLFLAEKKLDDEC